jgi:outer membrane receptor for ferrienterochelin and colicins
MLHFKSYPLSFQKPLLLPTLLSTTIASGAWAQESQAPSSALQPIVVTATSTERRLQDAPASISVITREELESRPVQDLADALQGTPGVYVGGVGLARRGVSIRGMSSEYTLTLVNGRRINQSGGLIGHSESDLGWIPAEAIERIEVVRGPMSSLYGSDALGGVVNVITRTATDFWKGSVSLNGSRRDDGRGGETHQLGVYAGGPLIPGELGISVYAETRNREATPSAANPALSEMEGREADSANVTLNWTPTVEQRVEAMFAKGKEERARDTQQTGATPYIYTSTDNIERTQWSLSHTGKWANAETVVRAYGSTLDKTNARTRGTPTRPQVLTEKIADARVTVPFGDMHRVSFGGEWRHEELEDTATNAAGYADTTHRALFAQDEIEFSKAWSLVLGDRLDRHEQFGQQHSPRAYLVHRVSDEFVIKGGVGRGFKAPNLKLLSPEYSVTTAGFTVYGNPALRPEISTSYEIGADYQAKGWSLQATIFQNNVKDLIQSRCVANCDAVRVLNYENIDQARIRGVELGGSLGLTSTATVKLNYTYLDAVDKTGNKPLAERPRHSANAKFEWTPSDDLALDLRGEFAGKQVIYSSEVQYPLPSYSLWSIDANYQLTKSVRLQASIENLGDTLLSDKSSRFRYVEPGRTFVVGMNAVF